MEINENKLLDFKGEYKLGKYPPRKNGYYMTVRCGLGGIYTHLDEWKDNKWMVGILDDSDVIAYSKEQITKEQVEDWCKKILEKYNNKNEDN